MNNLKRKLSSRKFWVLIASFISSLLLAFNLSENEIAQITSIIMAFGSVITYIFVEGNIDKEAIKKE